MKGGFSKFTASFPANRDTTQGGLKMKLANKCAKAAEACLKQRQRVVITEQKSSASKSQTDRQTEKDGGMRESPKRE